MCVPWATLHLTKAEVSPLYVCIWPFYNKYSVCKLCIVPWQVPPVTLETFLSRVEEGYCRHKNPYHNNLHAADVAQTVHYMLCQTGLMVNIYKSGLNFSKQGGSISSLLKFLKSKTYNISINTFTSNILSQCQRQQSTFLKQIFNLLNIITEHGTSVQESQYFSIFYRNICISS
jgi:hypothetical protein